MKKDMNWNQKVFFGKTILFYSKFQFKNLAKFLHFMHMEILI